MAPTIAPDEQTHCGYSECGESLLADAYTGLYGGRFCNERCAILELIRKSLIQLRDPRLQTVEDLRSIAFSALREAEWFALGCEVPPDQSDALEPDDDE